VADLTWRSYTEQDTQALTAFMRAMAMHEQLVLTGRASLGGPVDDLALDADGASRAAATIASPSLTILVSAA
jgi:hypothetical protein